MHHRIEDLKCPQKRVFLQNQEHQLQMGTRILPKLQNVMVMRVCGRIKQINSPVVLHPFSISSCPTPMVCHLHLQFSLFFLSLLPFSQTKLFHVFIETQWFEHLFKLSCMQLIFQLFAFTFVQVKCGVGSRLNYRFVVIVRQIEFPQVISNSHVLLLQVPACLSPHVAPQNFFTRL